ncbi:MAG: hypothetical protein II652_04295 [Bacteroidales bacterium]|nr:hypothetical protein [Bacteroidales bacterium]MBQ4298750.1 hypothetical protein [Bacteroidales bacterium]
MKRCLLLVFLFFPLLLQAGRPGVTVDGSLLFSSAYLWRGEKVCGLHFNPDVALHLGNLTLENYSFLACDGSYKEIDFDLSYRLGDFTFHLADYYFHYSDPDKSENYFDWKRGSEHCDEIALCYDSSAIPLNVKWFTFFWGQWIPDEEGRPGRLSFSSYLEVETYLELQNLGRLSLNLGASVLKGPYTGFSKDFMPIHIALGYSRSFDVGGFSVPIRSTVVFNPYLRTCMAEAALGLRF